MAKEFSQTEWSIEESRQGHAFLMGADENIIALFFNDADQTLFYGRTKEETLGNAEIARDAGNIAVQTGLFPTEALSQRNLLKAALIKIQALVVPSDKEGDPSTNNLKAEIDKICKASLQEAINPNQAPREAQKKEGGPE